jgi:hypothetical protein
MPQSYEYKLAQCDVADKRALESFRGKRSLWLSWLDDDEHHAIWRVLHDMVWRDVAFLSISEVAANDSGSALHKSLLSQDGRFLVSQGYGRCFRS